MDPNEPIRDTAGVEAIAERARESGRLALDFEFLWERTYAPVPCLAQIAIDGDVYIVDPVEGAPLWPIADLVNDPDVTVVMHAPSADLTLLALQGELRPASLVDVQIVAGFVGLGAGQGLAVLLERVMRVRLDKGERYTDWSRRPLSAGQRAYAAADVAHLLQLADELAMRAHRLGRTEWVAEEHRRRYGPDARFTTDPDAAWRKVKGQGRLNGRDRSVLRSLAAWREREARASDRPTSWIIPDRTLVELARRKPATRQALEGERGVPDRMRPAQVDEILGAIRAGERADPMAASPAPPPELQARADAIAPLGAVLVAARAAAVDLAPSLLATRDDITGFLTAALGGDTDGHPLASGWRHEIAGAALTDLAAGRLALAATPTRPYLREIAPIPDGTDDEAAPTA